MHAQPSMIFFHIGDKITKTTAKEMTTSSTSIAKFISDQPYLSMLENQCSNMSELQMIHAQLIKTGLINDTVAASRVLAFSASRRAGNIDYAFTVFTRIQTPNLFTWNTIIRAFSKSPTPQRAISLFVDMLVGSSVEPQRLTFPSVFKACAQLGQAQFGSQLHGRVAKLGLDRDEFVRNSMIHMYSSSGLLSEARKLFDESSDPDVVAWNSVIMGLAKCGELDEARRLFSLMPVRTSVSWNSMISGFVRNGKFVEALELFGAMQEAGFEPSEFTMVSLLNASGRLGAVRQGEWIHDYIVKNGVEMNLIVVTAIIDMYSKCGSVEKARRVFETVPKWGLSCWNSMIMGLATNGCEKEAIELFARLESSENLGPDDVSFLVVLTACHHAGLVDKARDYFLSMTEKYAIEPSIRHYTCMVDVLGQVGLLEEAERLILAMPLSPDAIIWGSLLSSCRKHGNVEMAQRVAERVVELDPSESSTYVLMSNIYSGSNQFDDAAKHRLSMRERRIEKEPGCSLIEVDGEVHEFVAFGRTHPRAKEIYSLLNE